MTAVQIINEIQHLPPSEKGRVVRFVRTLTIEEPLNGDDLAKLAEKLAGETDPNKTRELMGQIAVGFYGKA